MFADPLRVHLSFRQDILTVLTAFCSARAVLEALILLDVFGIAYISCCARSKLKMVLTRSKDCG